MNKFLKILFVVGASLTVLGGCFFDGPDEVNSLSISYAGDEIKLVPDYEIRNLDVNYDDSQGYIGGDFFDRFEELLGLLEKGIDQSENCDGGKPLKITRENRDNELASFEWNVCEEAPQEHVLLFVKYHDDLKALFTEEQY